MSSNDMTQASGLIGREAEFESGVAGLSDGPARWSWSLDRNAASITAEVQDSSGRVVATRTIEPSTTNGRFEWDRLLTGGSRASEGTYVLRLTAKDSSGSTDPLTIHSVGKVEEVVRGEGELWLEIGGASLPLSDLLRVSSEGSVA